ncbi:hypothetical protein [Burkholderia cenocepacia]|uniref:hypothetical protein n=1 Tax=Burkholderia cenocepacia TaxID=95486 RepID=UPI00098097E4|nr:hypothetical protein [Burkholderia cenocepacia]ONR56547.1 hypothetical protein A8E17_20835 [Burkholderia cenocepacia]
MFVFSPKTNFTRLQLALFAGGRSLMAADTNEKQKVRDFSNISCWRTGIPTGEMHLANLEETISI